MRNSISNPASTNTRTIIKLRTSAGTYCIPTVITVNSSLFFRNKGTLTGTLEQDVNFSLDPCTLDVSQPASNNNEGVSADSASSDSG